MKKNYLINIIDNAIRDNVPYIAIKQSNSLLKEPFINIVPRGNFESFKEALEAYNEDLELPSTFTTRKIKFLNACILKELPIELKLYFKM